MPSISVKGTTILGVKGTGYPVVSGGHPTPPVGLIGLAIGGLVAGSTLQIADNAANGITVATFTLSASSGIPAGDGTWTLTSSLPKVVLSATTGSTVNLVTTGTITSGNIGTYSSVTVGYTEHGTTATSLVFNIQVYDHTSAAGTMPASAGILNSGATSLPIGTYVDRGKYIFPKGAIPAGRGIALTLGGDAVSNFSALNRTYYVSDGSLMTIELAHALPAAIAAGAHPKYVFTPLGSGNFDDTPAITESAMPGALTVKMVISGASPNSNDNGTWYTDLNYALAGTNWSPSTGYGANPVRGKKIKGNGPGGKRGFAWCYARTATGGGGNMHGKLGGGFGWTLLANGKARIYATVGNIAATGRHPSATAGQVEDILRHYGKTSTNAGEQLTITVQLNGVDVPGLTWSNVCIGCLGKIVLPDVRSSDPYLKTRPICISAAGAIESYPDHLCTQDVTHILERTGLYPNHPHGTADIARFKSTYEALGSAGDPIPYNIHGFNTQMWLNAGANSKDMSDSGPEGGLWPFGCGFYGLLQNTDKKSRAHLASANLIQHYKRRDGLDVSKGSLLDNSKKYPANTYIHQAASNTAAAYPADIRYGNGLAASIDNIWADGWNFDSYGGHNPSYVEYGAFLEPDPIHDEMLGGWYQSTNGYYCARVRFTATGAEDFLVFNPNAIAYQDGDIRTLTMGVRTMFYSYIFISDADPLRGQNMGFLSDIIRAGRYRLQGLTSLVEPYDRGTTDFTSPAMTGIGHFEYIGSDGGSWTGAINGFQTPYFTITYDHITYFADFMSDDALIITQYSANYYNGIANFASHRQCIGSYAIGGVFDHETQNLAHPSATNWTALMPLVQYYSATPPTNQWCDVAGDGGPGTSQEGYAHMHMSGFIHNRAAVARKTGVALDPTNINLTLTAGGRTLASYTTELSTAILDSGEPVFWRIPIVTPGWL